MAALSGNFTLASNAADKFLTTVADDLCIYTDANTQRIFIGNNVGSNAAITVNSGTSNFVGIVNINPSYNLDVNGTLRATSIYTPTWTSMSLNAGYTAIGSGYSTPAYYKDSTGRVWLRGSITNGTTGTTTIFTLPSGYVPVYTMLFSYLGNTVNQDIRIATSGAITITAINVTTGAAAAENTLLSLDNISFLTS